MISTEQRGRICRNGCHVRTIEESCISIHEPVKHRLRLGYFLLFFMNFLSINMRFKVQENIQNVQNLLRGFQISY